MRVQQKKWVKLVGALAFAAVALTGCTLGEDLEKEMTTKAERGEREAQYHLGMMYIEANGVNQSDRKGVFWLRKSAEQGYNEAQRNLGTIYEIGLATRKNFVEACKWYKLAADQGNSNALVEMKRLHHKMTHEEINQAARLAEAWRPKKF